MKIIHFVTIILVFFQLGCATYRPVVGLRYENYIETYDQPNGNRRFRNDVTGSAHEKMSFPGYGVELGMINQGDKYTATGSLIYTKINRQTATSVEPGNPELDLNGHSAGIILSSGMNLIKSPLTLRPEFLLKYQTYYFETSAGALTHAPLALISHSYAGLGLAVQVPLPFFSLLIRGSYSMPFPMDNEELDNAETIDVAVSLIIGG